MINNFETQYGIAYELKNGWVLASFLTKVYSEAVDELENYQVPAFIVVISRMEKEG